MTGEEREIFISMLQQLRHELGHRPDKQQDSIILSYIELILNYAKRFYDRQFMTRRQDNNDILARFEKLLDDYYNNETIVQRYSERIVLCRTTLHVIELLRRSGEANDGRNSR